MNKDAITLNGVFFYQFILRNFMIDHSVKATFLTKAYNMLNLQNNQKEEIMFFLAEEWDKAFNEGIIIGFKNTETNPIKRDNEGHGLSGTDHI
jgi:hypothetical protein